MGEHHNVAPADEAYVNNDKEHEDGGPVQPSGSSGPTFPPPVGIDPQVLRDAGVGHAYFGVGSDEHKDEAAGDDERPARKQAVRGQHAQRTGTTD